MTDLLIHSSFTATITTLKYITITYINKPRLFKALHSCHVHKTTNEKYRTTKRKYSQLCGPKPPYILYKNTLHT